MGKRLSPADAAFVNALAAVVVPVVRDRASDGDARAMVRDALARGADTDAPLLAGLARAWGQVEGAEATGDVAGRARAEMVLRDELARFFRWRAARALEQAGAARKGAA